MDNPEHTVTEHMEQVHIQELGILDSSDDMETDPLVMEGNQSIAGSSVQVIKFIGKGDSQSEDEDTDTNWNTTELESLTKEQEEELTQKFLSGELSFSEYAALMEGEDADDLATTQSFEMAKFEQEMQASNERGKDPSTSRKRRARRMHLTPILQGLMGEANLRYARGERELAVQMCLKIIRQAPTAPEPFETLASLYQELGLREKSIQYALIAAHLNPSNANQWITLAEMSVELGKERQAVACYTRAIRADPQNIDSHVRRAQLWENLGDRKLALKAYMKLLAVLTPEHGHFILHMARSVAMKFHEDKDVAKAVEAMEVLFNKCPDLVTSEEVNIMLDLLLSMRNFTRCLEILVQYCQIEVEAEAIGDSNQIVGSDLRVLSCCIPDSIAIDLQAKLTVVMVHLKAFHLTDELVELLMDKASSEEAGDLYLDVAEAFIEEGKFEEALRLTSPLVEGNKYSLPAVWLRHAESLKACRRYEEAVHAYEVLVHQAPQHLEARTTLSALLTQLGHADKAVTVLIQDPKRDVLDPGLLYKRCMLLRDAPGQEAEFIAVGQLLLSRHCMNIRNREEMAVMSRMRRIDKKNNAISEVRRARSEPESDVGAPRFDTQAPVPTVNEEWQLFYDMCSACHRIGQNAKFQRIAFSALGSRRFISDNNRLLETEFLALLSCIHNNDAFSGYNLVRDMVLRKESRRVWNLFNQVVQRADHVRHNRFFIRQMMRHLDHEGLLILHANNCLVAGTYKYALTDYMSAFRINPNPMVALMIGITLFQIACQKFSARKNSLVIQGLAFFGQYQKLRGPEGQQEVNYNLGRAFHQLALLPAAIHHYEKVLEFQSEVNTRYANILDLKKEAAFNLHLIYMNSDAPDLARYYTHKYINV